LLANDQLARRIEFLIVKAVLQLVDSPLPVDPGIRRTTVVAEARWRRGLATEHHYPFDVVVALDPMPTLGASLENRCATLCAALTDLRVTSEVVSDEMTSLADGGGTIGTHSSILAKRMTSTPTYHVAVLVEGRPEKITGPRYAAREQAEAELRIITEAQQRGTEAVVALPWLSVRERAITAAFVEQRWKSLPRASSGGGSRIPDRF
jgi:hypothetical protein